MARNRRLLRRCAWLLGGGLLLTLAQVLPRWVPKWQPQVTHFLQANLLFVGTLLVGGLFLFLWVIPKWQVAGIADPKARLTLESEFRQTLAQILGGVALLTGLFFTAQTLRVSQEGQITERFTKAIEQLGKTGDQDLALRLGGIYALERIAKDSGKDHWTVMEVLTAFVREHARVQASSLQEPAGEDNKQQSQEALQPAADIQAILTVLGRRTTAYEHGKYIWLNLRSTSLQGANLGRANLQWADLQQADLQQADLQRADLQRANLGRANLQRANLQRANLGQANLGRADFRNSNLTQGQVDSACVDEITKLPEGLNRPPPCSD